MLKHGAQGIFTGPVRSVRDFRVSHTGLRSLIELDGQQIKFEIVREGRIDLSGAMDAELGCPVLGVVDQCAEKLLANNDLGMDPYTHYRDLIDLGVLALADGRSIPPAAIDKAARAYPDVLDGVRKVVTEIGERPQRLADAAEVLRMDPGLARRAVSAVARQVVGTAPGSVGPAGADGP